MRALRVVRGLAFATKGTYSRPLWFARYMCPNYREELRTRQEVLFYLEAQAARFAALSRKKPVSHEVAMASIVVPDITRLRRTAHTYLTDDHLDESHINAEFDHLKLIFARYGLDLGDVTVSVCDSFPEPYENMDFWAMNLDVGIMLRRKWIMPFNTAALVAHELVHAALGQQPSGHLARGFEEGLADLFGTLLVASELTDFSVAENIIVNSRFMYPPRQFDSLYAEGLRQACTFAAARGWGELITLVRQGNLEGRDCINCAERQLLTHGFGHVLLRDQKYEAMERVVQKFLSYPQSLVVSPLGFLMAEKITQGVSIKEILTSYDIPHETGLEALAELQQRVFLAVTHDGRVTADETKLFLETCTVRYDITQKDIDREHPNVW